MPRSNADDTEITRGSGNVFADIGLADPDEEAIKARLVMTLRSEMTRRKLSQAKAAELIGLAQPDVSNLLRGRVAGFSLHRMLEIMEALGNDVEITVRSTGTERRGRRTLTVA
jgi:predicted XRE-type DNA-binding protein